MPPAVTASTGLDALTQLIEPFVSSRANPLTDALCREGMRRIARSLHRAYEHGDDMSARLDMALAALFSGMALANAGLGSVHGFAGVIGGMVRGPHGAVCAALLPHAMRVNLRAFLERAPESEALQRYAELGRLLTGGNAAGAAEAVAWIEDTCAALRVPPLETYGLRPDHLPQIIEKSAAASSMRANPIALTRDEMHEIVIAALGGLPDRPRSSDAA
jgi:alcohol dehydrogenase class IV